MRTTGLSQPKAYWTEAIPTMPDVQRQILDPQEWTFRFPAALTKLGRLPVGLRPSFLGHLSYVANVCNSRCAVRLASSETWSHPGPRCSNWSDSAVSSRTTLVTQARVAGSALSRHAADVHQASAAFTRAM